MRLSDPQHELLMDIATHPVMYITCYSKWDRTARALIARELAEVADNGYPQYALTITDKGRVEADARGFSGGTS